MRLPWLERTTDERRARRLRQQRERTEGSWQTAMEVSCRCSQVVAVLEAAEMELGQDPFSQDDSTWLAAQGRVQHSIFGGLKGCQEYLKQEPVAQLLWTKRCMQKALEACQDRQCRPSPEPEYLPDNKEVPVCGAMEYLMKAASMPSPEEIYESQAHGWDPNKFKPGDENAAANDW